MQWRVVRGVRLAESRVVTNGAALPQCQYGVTGTKDFLLLHNGGISVLEYFQYLDYCFTLKLKSSLRNTCFFNSVCRPCLSNVDTSTFRWVTCLRTQCFLGVICSSLGIYRNTITYCGCQPQSVPTLVGRRLMITGQWWSNGIFIFVLKIWTEIKVQRLPLQHFLPCCSIATFPGLFLNLQYVVGLLFFRLITDTEEGVNVEVNNQGSYNTVCVELDMASLAVNTLIQVTWFELSSCSFLMLSPLKLMVHLLWPNQHQIQYQELTTVKLDVNNIGLDLGEK